ncbi:MAG: response regulator [Chloroflexi bacterium]|nr:response regulator [Chloroflexota bacterium]
MKKILIIEDQEPIVTLLKAILGADGGYELLVARDGGEAQALAKTERPELIIVGTLAHAEDSYGVCRCLRANGEAIPCKIIMIGNWTDETSGQKAIEAGADEFVDRPWPALLMRTVKAVLLPQGQEYPQPVPSSPAGTASLARL